jgi:hypothetical protein
MTDRSASQNIKMERAHIIEMALKLKDPQVVVRQLWNQSPEEFLWQIHVIWKDTKTLCPHEWIPTLIDLFKQDKCIFEIWHIVMVTTDSRFISLVPYLNIWDRAAFSVFHGLTSNILHEVAKQCRFCEPVVFDMFVRMLSNDQHQFALLKIWTLWFPSNHAMTFHQIQDWFMHKPCQTISLLLFAKVLPTELIRVFYNNT